MQAWGEKTELVLSPLVDVLKTMPLGLPPTIVWGAKKSMSPSPLNPGPIGTAINHLEFGPKKHVFISYRHSETGDLVAALYRELHQRNWIVVYDKEGLENGGSISAFVDQVKEVPFLLPVISRTYFESLWCLSEFFNFFAAQRIDPTTFGEQSVAVIMDEVQIDKPLDQHAHAQRIEALCKSLQGVTLSERMTKLLKVIQAGRVWMADIMDKLTDPLLPRGDESPVMERIKTIVDVLDQRYEIAVRADRNRKRS